MKDQLMTIEQAAKHFKLGNRLVYRWASSGKLPIVLIAGRRFIDVGAVTQVPEPLQRGNRAKKK